MTEIITSKYNLNISKEKVRQALLTVDPDGVEARRNKTIKRRIYEAAGPMDVMHIDGNDKLKRFGFSVHGAIDGFSRKLLWLVVSTTNKDPIVIANLYLRCVYVHGTAPNTLRMDLGTENVYCEDLQTFFTGDEDSFLYAGSTRNQRIESFWSRLKKFRLSWWINFFCDMIDRHIFLPANVFHQAALLYSFLPVIQVQLNEVVSLWNRRNIRQSSSAPGGIPDMLFAMPQTVGLSLQGHSVNSPDIAAAKDVLGIQHHPVVRDDDIHELFNCYVHINSLEIPRDPDSALSFYVEILALLDNDGFDV